MTKPKIPKEIFLTEIEVKTFFHANILHSIDKDLLKMTAENFEVSVKRDSKKFEVVTTFKLGEKEMKATAIFSSSARTYNDSLRLMMYGLMEMLQTLSIAIRNNRPVLHIVKD